MKKESKWQRIPEYYDHEKHNPPHENNVLLGWRDWQGEWQCEVRPYSTGRRNSHGSSLSYHGNATHWMFLPEAPDT